MTDEADRILVAGGGPVGFCMALLLARAGVKVTVVEQEADLVIDYRASTIHPPTLELLEECGAADFMLREGLRCPVWQLRDRKMGKVAEFDLALLKNDTPYPFRLQCEQFKLARFLHDELAKIPGADIRFSTRLDALAQDETGVTATLEGPAGREEAGFSWLIGCDGGRSTVRKALGVGFAGFTHPEHFLVAGTRHDFRRDMPDICSVNYTADPEEWFLLLEIPDMWRVVLPVAPEVEANTAVGDAYLQNALRNVCPRAEPYPLLVRAIYRVHQRVAQTYRIGRCFLAGDAAHLNNPIGGMGLNGGLHDAIDLAPRLAAVIREGADPRTLDGYEARRKPEAIDAIHAMTERNKKLMEERDPAVRAARLDEMRRLAADPARARDYLLQTSMIASLRRSGLLPARAGG
jgi:3-(3-hydroxy-phenyl)propionate hydroxylase